MAGVRKTVIKNEWKLSDSIGCKTKGFTGDFIMNKLLSCKFNIDTGNAELSYTDGV